jgi:hypothetical protein
VDLFLAISRGIGLALAAGVAGAGPAWVPVLVPVALGAGLFALSLVAETGAWWAGLAGGGIAAWFAFQVAGGVRAGAAERAGEEGGALALILVLVGVGLAIASLLVPPISLIALVVLAWLALARRRRAGEKHAGLRVLR